jgi:predicted Zn-dependent protease
MQCIVNSQAGVVRLLYFALVACLILSALGLGVQVGVLLPFNRTQEQEADLIDLNLMAQAGFDPRQSITLWQNMAGNAESSPPESLSTHPSSNNRIQSLSARMPAAMTL